MGQRKPKTEDRVSLDAYLGHSLKGETMKRPGISSSLALDPSPRDPWRKLELYLQISRQTGEESQSGMRSVAISAGQKIRALPADSKRFFFFFFTAEIFSAQWHEEEGGGSRDLAVREEAWRWKESSAAEMESGRKMGHEGEEEAEEAMDMEEEEDDRERGGN
jgi:hypothetical protein